MTERFAARRKKQAKGTTLIEFALVTLMLMLVLLGVFELSRMVLVLTTIANAARAGVRYATVHGSDRSGGSGYDGQSGPANNPAQVLTVVKNFASGGLMRLNSSNISVTYSPSNAPGSVVTVTVTYTYDPFISYFNNSLRAHLGSTSQGVITF
jgi:Flp pilus assembly protein TadG